jgi:4-amino-4-deoxy-L-arabinose transferase-like glycosyltransferase
MQARAEEISSPHPSSSQHSSRAFSVWWIVLIALLLRLAVITIGHTYRITPRRDHFQYGWEMGRIARSIALGQGFSSPTDLPTGASAWAPPAYPYILAGVFRIFGIYSNASAWVILAFNSIFSALTCWLLYRIAQKLYGEGAARAGAWTWAVFPYAVYWPVRVVWETSLSAFMLTLALLLTLRIQEQHENIPLHRWISFGLLWGVIALTNTALLIFFPFCLVWLFHRLPGKTRQISRMALCVFTSVLVMTPWLVRNYQVFGKFVFIRDNLPLELYMANNDLSTGMWTRTEHPGNDPEAMRRFQELGEISFMQEKKQQLEAFLREHPERFIRFTLERTLYFWVGTPQLTLVGSYNFLYFRHMTFFLGSAFAFAGLWLTFRRRIRGVFLLATLVLVYPLPYYLVNPFPRYKHPIEPVMLLLIVYLFYEARRIPVCWPAKS